MAPSAVDRVIPGLPLADDGDVPLNLELHRRSGPETEPHAYRRKPCPLGDLGLDFGGGPGGRQLTAG